LTEIEKGKKIINNKKETNYKRKINKLIKIIKIIKITKKKKKEKYVVVVGDGVVWGGDG
jgi:hypothetical protein